jgi:hypothetical protein
MSDRAHFGGKSLPFRPNRARSGGLGLPNLFTLSPLPCIKGMVIWQFLA